MPTGRFELKPDSAGEGSQGPVLWIERAADSTTSIALDDATLQIIRGGPIDATDLSPENSNALKAILAIGDATTIPLSSLQCIRGDENKMHVEVIFGRAGA